MPNGERNSAGYFVETSGLKIMLDCGAGTVHALAKYGIEWQQMTHLFISHFHVDHIGELAPLFFAFRHGLTGERKQPLTLIAPSGFEQLLTNLKAAFGEKTFAPKFPLQVRLVTANESLSIGEECKLLVAKTPHTEESLAVRIEHRGKAIGYTGDTDFSDSLIPFFGQADLLISECSFVERKEGVAHLSIQDVGRLAEGAKVKRLVVTHFYFTMPENELRRRLQEVYSGEIIIGKDGLVSEI